LPWASAARTCRPACPPARCAVCAVRRQRQTATCAVRRGEPPRGGSGQVGVRACTRSERGAHTKKILGRWSRAVRFALGCTPLVPVLGFSCRRAPGQLEKTPCTPGPLARGGRDVHDKGQQRKKCEKSFARRRGGRCREKLRGQKRARLLFAGPYGPFPSSHLSTSNLHTDASCYCPQRCK